MRRRELTSPCSPAVSPTSIISPTQIDRSISATLRAPRPRPSHEWLATHPSVCHSQGPSANSFFWPLRPTKYPTVLDFAVAYLHWHWSSSISLNVAKLLPLGLEYTTWQWQVLGPKWFLKISETTQTIIIFFGIFLTNFESIACNIRSNFVRHRLWMNGSNFRKAGEPLRSLSAHCEEDTGISVKM